MTGDDARDGADGEHPRVPRPLRERADELFAAHHGYEPASFQESLKWVLDVAATATGSAADVSAGGQSAALPSEPSAGESDGSRTGRPSESSAEGSGAQRADPAPAPEDTTTDVTTTDGTTTDVTVDVETGQPLSDLPDDPPRLTEADDATPVDDAEPRDAPDPSDPAVDDDAVSEYLQELSVGDSASHEHVGPLLETENADGTVRELATDVLDDITGDAFAELEDGVNQGNGGVADGGAEATIPSRPPEGTVPSSEPDEAALADPETECERCGQAYRVSVLRTTILEQDGSVALVCPACSE